MRRPSRCALGILLLAVISLALSCASQRAVATAEEYYALGMAYFEMGRFEEAEAWLNRAKELDKTKSASDYNLGRIAYETGRYQEASDYFQSILRSDPQNVMALKAAAYTWVKLGDHDQALATYQKVLDLTPESADDGFNYALILYAMGKAEESEAILLKYSYALEEQNDSLLLLARVQKALDKVEAADSYYKWLQKNKDIRVQAEYAQVLEANEFYARALEEYRSIQTTLAEQRPEDKKRGDPPLSQIYFDIGRVLLIADGENPEGPASINLAIAEGFADEEALEALESDSRISAAHREELSRIRDTLSRAPQRTEQAEEQDSETEGEEAEESEEDGSEADV